MNDLPRAIATGLSAVQRPGDFYASGTLDMHPLRLDVAGIGPVALPLLPAQAEQLVAVAEQAPYGRGSETLVDTDVRRTWQLDATRVCISGRRWAEDLAQIVRDVAAGLGVAGRVEAELYKLLIYDAGSFFVPHRDTEKAAGMFATLVVVLPSPYTGGELVVRHKDREARLDLRRDEPSEVAWAAFYADCRHEVLPIASGYRLALVYNLIRPDGEPVPLPPDYDSVRESVAALLRQWSDGPLKLVLPLEHAYSEAELGFGTLKGADAAVTGVALAAAQSAGCDLHLGLVTLFESGIAEHVGGGYWDDDGDFEIIESTDEGRTIHDWRLPDGSAPAIGELPFDDDELSPPDAFAGFDDIEPHFHEATGNEGASYERSYQRAALVLWPRGHRAAVLAGGGLAVSLPYLSKLLEGWQQAGAVHGDEDWQQAHALAIAIRDAWPAGGWQGLGATIDGRVGRLLDALSRLGDRTAAAVFIAGSVAAGAYDAADNGALAAVLAELPAVQVRDLLTAVISGNGAVKPAACADLLVRCTAWPDGEPPTLIAAGLALLSALPGAAPQPEDQPPMLRWRREPPSPALVADTLTALMRIDAGLADQALALFLSEPTRYPIDEILLPAALRLAHAEPSPAAGTALVGLRDAVVAHLERRIAEPLAPPADWQRPAEIQCRCSYCRNLSDFLGSPTESVWHLKAAQDTRTHVEHSIQRGRCDLDCTTDRQGRPYTLVCKKNRASYERRVRQREKDLADRESLGAA
jgi:predicted 2-oxoglutarate/Fe(II)-dependent dioxygenase YbiX